MNLPKTPLSNLEKADSFIPVSYTHLFVNVVESKKLIMEGKIPYIVSKGNKGGSTVAAAIVNAVLYKIGR